MARIDALSPEDRSLVRRVAVFGLTFHPKMLSWFTDEVDGALPGPATWARLHEFFDEEPDGYLRFRRSLLRDAAYEGLPFKLRRRLHDAVAARIAQESDDVDESASILSLHHFLAGDNKSAWRYATIAGKRAESVYAYVEAAELYSRALDAGRQIEDLGKARSSRRCTRPWAMRGTRQASFSKASDAYAAARAAYRERSARWMPSLLNKLSHVEAKLGKYEAGAALDRAGPRSPPGNRRPEPRTANGTVERVVRRCCFRRGPDDGSARLGRANRGRGGGGRRPGGAWRCVFRDGMRRTASSARRERYRSCSVAGGLRALRATCARQADVLSNLGVVCQWEGRWDEALVLLRTGPRARP